MEVEQFSKSALHIFFKKSFSPFNLDYFYGEKPH